MPILNVFAPGSRLTVRATGDETVVKMVSIGERNGHPCYFVDPPVRVCQDDLHREVTVLFPDQFYCTEPGLGPDRMVETVYAGEDGA